MKSESHRTTTRRSHPKYKEKDTDFQIVSTSLVEALMSSSQKEPWKLEIPFRRRTGSRRSERGRKGGRERGSQHTPSASSTGQTPSTHQHTHTHTWSGKDNKRGMWVIHESTILLNSWIETYQPEHTHAGLASFIIDVIHCSPLIADHYTNHPGQ